MTRQATTRDLGLAIRDYVEGFSISQFEDDKEIPRADLVELVDVSDADNPVLHMESGAIFTIRIVRTG